MQFITRDCYLSETLAIGLTVFIFVSCKSYQDAKNENLKSKNLCDENCVY